MTFASYSDLNDDKALPQHRDLFVLTDWYQYFPCLALNIKWETLALSQKINKNTIFEGLMED